MRKVVLTWIFSIGMIAVSFGQLNQNAQGLKKADIDFYNSQFKKFAESEWSGNYEMIVYTINNQANAFVEFGTLNNQSDLDKSIMIKALGKWTKNGLTNFEMVVYTYKNQLKAKNSY